MGNMPMVISAGLLRQNQNGVFFNPAVCMACQGSLELAKTNSNAIAAAKLANIWDLRGHEAGQEMGPGPGGFVGGYELELRQRQYDQLARRFNAGASDTCNHQSQRTQQLFIESTLTKNTMC
jgi:hypothetical protein